MGSFSIVPVVPAVPYVPRWLFLPRKLLGAIRRNGRYELSGENLGWDSFARIVDHIKRGQAIGDHMTLLEVVRGTAGLVTSIIDESGWNDVAGTMASTDDKVLILTEDARRQANVLDRLPYAGAEE